MTDRTPVPINVADELVRAQLRALDVRLKQYRKVTAMRWSNKHVPPSAPVETIIMRAANEIIDIQSHTKGTT